MLESGKITVEVRSLNGKTADIGIKTSMLSGKNFEPFEPIKLDKKGAAPVKIF